MKFPVPILGVGALLLAGCAEATAPDRTVSSVVVTGALSTLAPTATRQLSAAVRNAAGDPLDGKDIAWSSDSEAVAIVSATGLVLAVAPGSTTIRAASEGVVGMYAITVAYRDCSPSTISGTIAVGQTIAGAYTHAGCIRGGVGPFVGYSITVASPVNVVYELTNAGARAFLVVANSLDDDVFVSESIAPGDEVRALMALSLGTSYVWIASGEGELGSFSLSASVATLCAASDATAGQLAADVTFDGEIIADTCLLPHGYEGQGWAMSVPSDTSMQIEVVADGFYPWIVVTDLELYPLGFSFPDLSNEAFVAGAVPAGDYLVWVTSPGGGAGTYTIRRSAYTLSYCDDVPAVGNASIGGIVRGDLQVGDCRLVDGRLADRWTLTVPTDTTLQLDLASEAFDAYIYVVDASGAVIYEDDDSGGNFNSRVTRNFSAGTYSILATSFSSGEEGSYSITVMVSAGVVGGVVSAEPAAPKARPRLSWLSPPRP